jgi:formate dehydrogenase subunit gamma
MGDRQLVLRYYPSEKIFHAINAASWAFLIYTGLCTYFKWVSPETAAAYMHWHVIVAILFTLNLVGFILLAPDRALIMIQSLLTWNRNVFAWYRNLGGYPRKILGIPFGPKELAPQGRYNGGQKPIYLYLLTAQWVLAITGWVTFLLVPAIPKAGTAWMHSLHLWFAISATLLVVVIHIPLAFINWEFFKGIWRVGPGTIPLDVAKEEMAQWVAEDVIPVKSIPAGE